MESSIFDIKVYTPVGLVLEDSAGSILLPGGDGELGILPQHIKYVTRLGTGVVEYVSSASKQSQRMVVSGGFCSFSESTLTILTDAIAFPQEVDIDEYSQEREELLTFVAEGHLDDPECVKARERLEYIDAMDKLVSQ